MRWICHFTGGAVGGITGGMKSELLDALLKSPALPDIIQEVNEVISRERRLREKFYKDITPEHKWEFILGEVIMHSPALNRHLLATQRLFQLMNIFTVAGKLGQVRTEKAMTVFPRNDFEPDIVFFGPVKSTLIDADTLRFPIPDLIVEVLSPSTEARDRGVKFQDYEFHGVREYWIVDAVEETVELYRLSDGAYLPAERQKEGTLASDVLPGFQIPVRAIFDETENLATLRRLMPS
jgi:Uma2 family endonuclease